MKDKNIFYKWLLLVGAIFVGCATRADMASWPPSPVLPEARLLLAFLACSVIVAIVSMRKKSPYAPVWIVFLSLIFYGVSYAMWCLIDSGCIFVVGLMAWVISVMRLIYRKRFAWAACMLVAVPCLFFVITVASLSVGEILQKQAEERRRSRVYMPPVTPVDGKILQKQAVKIPVGEEIEDIN